MLNPKTNVGKLRNGVFTILFAYFQDGRQIEEKSIKICRVTEDAKLVQINPKTSSHDWGSSLTSIYAFRIKI